MGQVHPPEWDDSELVPLGELRPSREYFGPIARPNQNQNADPKARAKAKQRQAAGQPQRPRSAKSTQADPRRRDGHQASERQQAPRRQVEEPRRREEPAMQRQSQPQRRPQPQQQQPQREESRQPRPQPRRVEGEARPPVAQQQPAQQKAAGLRSKLLRRDDVPDNVVDVRDHVRRAPSNSTIAVFSRKGGVGKTTISAYLGLTLAAERGGRIVAVDGDSEAGSLGWMLSPNSPSTLAALAGAAETPRDYEEFSRYTVVTPGGVEVIVGDTDNNYPVSPAGLHAAVRQLAKVYDYSIFDTGGGVSRDIGGVLVHDARLLILAMSPSVDSVRAAERTLAWLADRPGQAIDPHTQIVAVINGIPSNMRESHVAKIENHFASQCAATVRIPWDEYLASGRAAVGLDRLAKSTRRAFSNLASVSVDVLANSAGGRRQVGASNVG